MGGGQQMAGVPRCVAEARRRLLSRSGGAAAGTCGGRTAAAQDTAAPDAAEAAAAAAAAKAKRHARLRVFAASHPGTGVGSRRREKWNSGEIEASVQCSGRSECTQCSCCCSSSWNAD